MAKFSASLISECNEILAALYTNGIVLHNGSKMICNGEIIIKNKTTPNYFPTIFIIYKIIKQKMLLEDSDAEKF